MGSVAILVALVVQKQDTALLELPLLHPKYHWSEDLASGLANYANYWIKTLKEQSITEGQGMTVQYTQRLEVLIEHLKGGHAKKCRAWKELGYSAKASEDRLVVKNFLSFKKMIQPGLRRAYCLLIHIGDKYSAAAELPARIRALANTIITGA